MAATKKARTAKKSGKRSSAKGAVKRFASKSANKSKSVSFKAKVTGAISLGRGTASTAPVVYQTLRERIAAVDANVGATEDLKDFRKSTGWQ
jgi:hypothetical protein